MEEPSPEPFLLERRPVPDAIRMQILATEHWSLLATRSMTWNEMFTRASMFITTLSGAIVALALIAQATSFGANFRLFALLVLPIVLLLGIGTLIRLADANREDMMHVVGMNRLRHAYLDIDPDLARYFTTSHHDDLAGIMLTRDAQTRFLPSRIIASTPFLIGIVDAAIAGTLAGLLVKAVNDRSAVYLTAGIGTALIAAIVMCALLPYREITKAVRELETRFPG